MPNSSNFKTEEDWNAEYKTEVPLFTVHDIITPTCGGLQLANVNVTKVHDKLTLYSHLQQDK